MAVSASRQERRQLERDSAKWPVELQPVNRDAWPTNMRDSTRLRVWRSRHFLVQEFATAHGDTFVRLSINRTIGTAAAWDEGITWDELQRIKRECGYGDRDAIEIFPADLDVVNVANMRHLWIMSTPIPFAWRAKP